MENKKKYVPDRGDIVILSFSPQLGHEQAGTRPALVLSPQSYNKIAGLILCCPITRTRRSHPFEVQIPKGHATTGAVLVEHIRSLAWQVRKANFVEKAPLSVIDEVSKKLVAIVQPGGSS